MVYFRQDYVGIMAVWSAISSSELFSSKSLSLYFDLMMLDFSIIRFLGLPSNTNTRLKLSKPLGCALVAFQKVKNRITAGHIIGFQHLLNFIDKL